MLCGDLGLIQILLRAGLVEIDVPAHPSSRSMWTACPIDRLVARRPAALVVGWIDLDRGTCRGCAFCRAGQRHAKDSVPPGLEACGCGKKAHRQIVLRRKDGIVRRQIARAIYQIEHAFGRSRNRTAGESSGTHRRSAVKGKSAHETIASCTLHRLHGYAIAIASEGHISSHRAAPVLNA